MFIARVLATTVVWGVAMVVAYFAFNTMASTSPWAVVAVLGLVFWAVSESMRRIWVTP
jgi:hypothetical protein